MMNNQNHFQQHQLNNNNKVGNIGIGNGGNGGNSGSGNISNSGNNNDDDDDTICFNHNSQYLYICKNCYCLICIKCLTSNHKSHEIAEISITNIKSIIREFKNHHHIYTLNGYLKSDKVTLNSANHCFQDIESKYKKNKQDIDNDFNQLFQILKHAQQEAHSKLDLEFKKNLEYYEKLKTQIENDEKILKPIINRNYNHYREINFSDDAQESIQRLNINNSYNNKNSNNHQLYNNNNNNNLDNEESSSDDDNNNNNQKYNYKIIKYYSILKDALKTRSLIDERIERSRCNNNENCGSPLKSLKNSNFKDFSISINQDSFNQIKELLHSKLNNLYIAKLSNYQDTINFHHNMINKKFSIGQKQFYLTNGEPIPMDIEHLALSSNIDIISAHSILNCSSSLFKSLFFCNGFPHPISPNIIPESIESLFVCGIKHILVRDSIPTSVKNLFLFDGFNQDLSSNDFISLSISSLSIYNILYPIESQCIPKSITKLSLHDYQFPIIPELIPTSITNLLIGNTKYPIQHIPDSVLEITFFEGYSHPIDSNILPSSLLRLTLSKIKYPITKCLPSSLKEISFIHGYNHIISSDIIPSSVTLISLGQISEPLNIHSIPDTVEIVQFLDSYNHKIQKETIKNIKTISFYDIKYPLCNNSIPSSVKEVHFHDNFNHLIIPGTIGSSVETLFINNIKFPLVEGSIPNTIKQIYIDKYYHTLLPGHLPFSINKLIIGDIDPLVSGSIPPTVNMLQISLDYKYKIDSTILPPSVKVINCQE